LRLESAMETAKSKLALIEGALRPILAARSRSQTDELTTNSQDTPFVLQPMPWVLGALSPCHFCESHDASRLLSRPMCRIGQSARAGS
jgi:hypothetical protein